MEGDDPEIFKGACKYCDKVIASLSKKQADINLAVHEMTCKQKGKLKKEVEKEDEPKDISN